MESTQDIRNYQGMIVFIVKFDNLISCPQNNLNPEWRQITLLAQELPSEGKKLRFQVYDDDGKLGPDASDHLIGEGFYSIEDLGMLEIVKL